MHGALRNSVSALSFQICTKCVRCKSCGATTPGKGWDAQWSHDFSLCHDCAKLFAKGTGSAGGGGGGWLAG